MALSCSFVSSKMHGVGFLWESFCCHITLIMRGVARMSF